MQVIGLNQAPSLAVAVKRGKSRLSDPCIRGGRVLATASDCRLEHQAAPCGRFFRSRDEWLWRRLATCRQSAPACSAVARGTPVTAQVGRARGSRGQALADHEEVVIRVHAGRARRVARDRAMPWRRGRTLIDAVRWWLARVQWCRRTLERGSRRSARPARAGATRPGRGRLHA